MRDKIGAERESRMRTLLESTRSPDPVTIQYTSFGIQEGEIQGLIMKENPIEVKEGGLYKGKVQRGL